MEQSGRKTQLIELNRQTTEAAVYLTFFTQKSQKNGVKFIYGIEKDEELKRVNQAPVINARRRLGEAGYIETVGRAGRRLTSPLLVSTPKPITEYAAYALAFRGIPSKKTRIGTGVPRAYTLSEKEKAALSIIFSSRWFRELVSQKTEELAGHRIEKGRYAWERSISEDEEDNEEDDLEDMEEETTNKRGRHRQVPVETYAWEVPMLPRGYVLKTGNNVTIIPRGDNEYCYRDEYGKLVVPAVLRYIADIMDDIAELTLVMSSIVKVEQAMPELAEVISHENFDEFAERWVAAHLVKYKGLVKKVISIGGGHYSDWAEKDLMEYSKNLYFLCIPRVLAGKLIGIGRVETTLFVGLLGGVLTLEKDKRYSEAFSAGRTKFIDEI